MHEAFTRAFRKNEHVHSFLDARGDVKAIHKGRLLLESTCINACSFRQSDDKPIDNLSIYLNTHCDLSLMVLLHECKIAGNYCRQLLRATGPASCMQLDLPHERKLARNWSLNVNNLSIATHTSVSIQPFKT